MNKLSKFPYENVLVLGLAKSGTATAKLLLKYDKYVRVNDYSTEEDAKEVIELREMGAEVIVGSHPFTVLDGIDVIIKNPGIPYDHPLLEEAVRRQLPIITEIELVSSFITSEKIISITGSNGKTTTTTLVHEMLIQSGKKVQLAGNIGIVASEVAPRMKKDETLLLELSSFQLLGVNGFHPRYAVLLNLFEAHLDYHKTIEHYENAKWKITQNQTADDFFIYNADDPKIQERIPSVRARKIPFSVKTKQPTGAWCDEDFLYFKTEKIIAKKDIVLVGEHNIANILAAIAVARLNGATIEGIYKVLTTFSGVKHRLQFVKEVQGRLFYNDSKATNMLATEIALQSFTRPMIWLAGGLDRGDDFDKLIPNLKHVKAVVLFGETAEKLKETAERANIKTILFAKNIEEATKKAYAISNEGDAILLSPACASWDQYKNFEIRGDKFVHTVHILASGG